MKMNLNFERADLVRDRDLLMRFNVEYFNWIADALQEGFGLSLTEAIGKPIPDHVEDMLQKLCESAPPAGVFYIVRNDRVAVGMGGLRKIRVGVGEIKRIYVPAALRGGGVGASILDRLIRDARAFGYRRLVLDSGPFMASAQRLYEAAGFEDISPYPESEVPVTLRQYWRYMQFVLSQDIPE